PASAAPDVIDQPVHRCYDPRLLLIRPWLMWRERPTRGDCMATPVDKPDSTIGTNAPIVVDFGKHRRKRVKQLRKGRGPLMAEVARCVQELQTAGTIGATAQP